MYIEMMETRPREQSMSALLTLAEVKADSVTFEAWEIMLRLPACAELQYFADFGGSEGRLSLLGSMFFSDPVYI